MRRPTVPCYLGTGSATRPPGDTPGSRLLGRGAGRTERPMDAIVKPTIVKNWPKGSNPQLSDHVRNAPQSMESRPTREAAEAAVRTLIAYIGDDPGREGLRDTPKRVVGAYEELYRGYRE